MARAEKPTKLFLSYAAQLVLRLVLFGLGIAACILAPEQLSMSESFGFRGGFDLIDAIFILIVLDNLTKFFPSAKISMGSLKQYGEFHVPTLKMFKGGREAVLAYAREMIAQGRIAIERFPSTFPQQLRTAWEETVSGTRDSIRTLLRSIDFLRLIPFEEELLSVDSEAREQIRRDRFRETSRAGAFWIAFNVLIAFALSWVGLIGEGALYQEQALIVWVLFYFLFDMICVVLWCPVQLLVMRNRCCTTCQIFNWDAIMTVTPLLLIAGDLACAWFAWPLLMLALVILVRWELAFARHPERFDERTNASLACANCKDKLCYIREPIHRKLPDIPSLAKTVTGYDGREHESMGKGTS